MASNQSVTNDGNDDVAVITGLIAQTLLTVSGINEDQEQNESQASASAPTVTATTDDSVAAPVRHGSGALRRSPARRLGGTVRSASDNAVPSSPAGS